MVLIIALNNYKTSILTTDKDFLWLAKQAYIAFGTELIVTLSIDAPMEGFDSQLLDKLLNLKAQGLKSDVLLSIGYRDEEKSFSSKLKKIRLPREEFATIV